MIAFIEEHREVYGRVDLPPTVDGTRCEDYLPW